MIIRVRDKWPGTERRRGEEGRETGWVEGKKDKNVLANQLIKNE